MSWRRLIPAQYRREGLAHYPPKGGDATFSPERGRCGPRWWRLSNYPQRDVVEDGSDDVLTRRAGAVIQPAARAVRLEDTARYPAALVWTGWVFVGLGCVLRILQYVANRSLSIDESFLALNLIEKSPQQLLHQLDFNQAAPLGFLETEKAAIELFGPNEYALRLLPLLASLLAVVVFYEIAQRILRPRGATLAVAVFALLDPLILYAATAKQYALDTAGIVLILAAALIVRTRPLRRSELLALGAFGAVLVWFSHAAAFGLAALGALLTLRVVESRRWTLAPILLAVIAAWSGSFTIQYVLSRSSLTGILGAFHQGGGAAFEPTGSGPTWFADAIDRVRYVVGVEDAASGQPLLASLAPEVNRGLTVLVVIVGVVGFVSLLRRTVRLALMLAVPPGLAVVASTLGQYPLVGRTALFALPSVALCVGEGIDRFIRVPAPNILRALSAAIALSFLAAIAILPTVHVVRPRSSQEMKDALLYLGARYERGDALYVSYGAQYAFAYYHLCGCSTFDPETEWPFTVISGSAAAVESRSPQLIIESGQVSADAEPLLGRERVWVLLVEMLPERRNSLLDYLGTKGALLKSFETRGPLPAAASVYLYDLRSSGG